MLLLSLGYWLWNRPLFLRLTLLVLASALINALLKDWLQDPRPAGIHLDTSVADSWGMPSGHAQVALVLWGLLAWEVNKRWCWWLCGVLISGITFSRVYLGVHDPQDLFAGLALGAITLAIYPSIRASTLWRRDKIALQLLLICAITLPLWKWWPQGGVSPALKLGGMAAGAVFGAWLDALRHQKTEREPPPMPLGLLLVPLVVAGLLLLQQLLGLLPKTDGAILLAGLLTGFTITRVAPALLGQLTSLVQRPWAKQA
jgi:glycerophosphoryl diester phosphodiesterase